MKTTVFCLVACFSLFAAVAVAGETPWYDPQNCQMCSAITEHTGLFQHLTMETYPIGNGMISVTTADPEYLDAYRQAAEKMAMTGQELMAGKEMKLCGCCQSTMALMKAGAVMENVPTKNGAVMLLTSNDQDVVAKIKAHAERSIMEMEKMMGGEHQHEGGEGR